MTTKDEILPVFAQGYALTSAPLEMTTKEKILKQAQDYDIISPFDCTLRVRS